MGERRALIIASQCEARHHLGFLPEVAAELRDVVMDARLGCCVPAVSDWDEPRVSRGLVTDPTVDQTERLLEVAFRAASDEEATLFIAYLGHAVERDGELFLQTFDAAEYPNDRTAVAIGRRVYQYVKDYPRVDGLVVLVDSCQAGLGVHDAGRDWVKAVSQAGRRLEVLSATGLEAAYGGAFSRAVTTLMRQGDSGLGDTLHCRDACEWAQSYCDRQAPWWLGFNAGRPVSGGDEGLWLGRNPTPRGSASPLRDTPVYGQILRLTECFQPTALVTQVVATALRERCLALVGEPGTGKSALAAALVRPGLAADIPERFVHAFVSLGEGDTLGSIARQIGQHLSLSVPGYDDASPRADQVARADEADADDPLDRYLGLPLRQLEPEVPVRVVFDGVDQLTPDVVGELLGSVSRLTRDPTTGALRILMTVRPDVVLPPGIHDIEVGRAADEAIAAYLAERDITGSLGAEIVRYAAGNWLLARLCADIGGVGSDGPETLPNLYQRHIRALGERAEGAVAAASIRTVLSVLAAAGTGPVLPIELLLQVTSALGGSSEVSRLRDTLALLTGSQASLVVRTHPGSADEHAGLFHETLTDYLRHGPSMTTLVHAAHRALLAALVSAAPRDQYDPLSAAHRYAATAEAEHLWALERFDEAVDSLEARPAATLRERQERWRKWHGRAIAERGVHDPVTLKLARGLARSTGRQGYRADALRQLEGVLADYQRIRGPRHKEVLRTRGQLAWELAESGFVREALAEYAALVPIQEEVLGPGHDDVFWTRSSQALWTGRSGDYQGAARMMLELVADQIPVQGANHPMVLKNTIGRAEWVGRLQGPAAAIGILEGVVQDSENAHGPDSDVTLRARRALAKWQQKAMSAAARYRTRAAKSAARGVDEVPRTARAYPAIGWRRLDRIAPQQYEAEYVQVFPQLRRVLAARQDHAAEPATGALAELAELAAGLWSPADYRVLELRVVLLRWLVADERYDLAMLMFQWITGMLLIGWSRETRRKVIIQLKSLKQEFAEQRPYQLRLLESTVRSDAESPLTGLPEPIRYQFAAAQDARSQSAYAVAIERLAAVVDGVTEAFGPCHPLVFDLRYTLAYWIGRYRSSGEGVRALEEVCGSALEFIVDGGRLVGGGPGNAARAYWRSQAQYRATPPSPAETGQTAGSPSLGDSWRRVETLRTETLDRDYAGVIPELRQGIDAWHRRDVDRAVAALRHAALLAAEIWSRADPRVLELRFTLAHWLTESERYEESALMAQWVHGALNAAWHPGLAQPLREGLRKLMTMAAAHNAHQMRRLDLTLADLVLAELPSAVRGQLAEARRLHREDRRQAVQRLDLAARSAAAVLGSLHPLVFDIRYTAAYWTSLLDRDDGVRMLDETCQDAWQLIADGGHLAGFIGTRTKRGRRGRRLSAVEREQATKPVNPESLGLRIRDTHRHRLERGSVSD